MDITGTAASTFGWSDAAAGHGDVIGSAASSFGFATWFPARLVQSAAATGYRPTATLGATPTVGNYIVIEQADRWVTPSPQAGFTTIHTQSSPYFWMGYKLAGAGEPTAYSTLMDQGGIVVMEWADVEDHLLTVLLDPSVADTPFTTTPFAGQAVGGLFSTQDSEGHIIPPSVVLFDQKIGVAPSVSIGYGDPATDTHGSITGQGDWWTVTFGNPFIIAAEFPLVHQTRGFVPISGSAASSFGWRPAATGHGDVVGSATSLFGWRPTAAGNWAANPVSGTAASSFGWSDSADGLTGYVLSGGSAFGWSVTSDGLLTFTGTIASEFRWTSSAGGLVANPITAAGESAFGWSDSAAGFIPITGDAATTFGWTPAATAFRDYRQAHSIFGWSTAVIGFQNYRGQAASSFGWAPSGTGVLAYSGVAASSFGWAAVGTSVDISGQTFPDNGDLFGWSTETAGDVAPAGFGGSGWGFETAATGIMQIDITGVGDSRFGFSSTGSGYADTFGVAASAFGWDPDSTAIGYSFYGPADPAWGFSSAGTGLVKEDILIDGASEFGWSDAGAGLLGPHVGAAEIKRVDLGPKGIWYQPPPPRTRPR